MNEDNKNNLCKEKNYQGVHEIKREDSGYSISKSNGLYSENDFNKLQNFYPNPIHVHILKSLDELLRRDEMRKEDGFPKKIKNIIPTLWRIPEIESRDDFSGHSPFFQIRHGPFS